MTYAAFVAAIEAAAKEYGVPLIYALECAAISEDHEDFIGHLAHMASGEEEGA